MQMPPFIWPFRVLSCESCSQDAPIRCPAPQLLDQLVSYGARLPFGPLLTRANVLHHVEVILAADRALQAADREGAAP